MRCCETVAERYEIRPPEELVAHRLDRTRGLLCHRQCAGIPPSLGYIVFLVSYVLFPGRDVCALELAFRGYVVVNQVPAPRVFEVAVT